LHEIGQSEEAVTMFKQGTEALPSSLLLHFSYAEFEEMRKRVSEARAVFEALVTSCATERENLQKLLEKEQKAEKVKEKDKEKEKEKEKDKDKEKDRGASPEKDEGAERIARIEEDLKRKMEQESLIYIMFMRFSKRAEDEPSLRALFRRARESPACTHHIFVASGLFFTSSSFFPLPVLIETNTRSPDATNEADCVQHF